MPGLKKKDIIEHTPKMHANTGSEYERITRSEEEGFYSSCGQAFIRIQRN